MNEADIRQIVEEVDPGGKISQATLEELISALKNIENPYTSTPGVIAGEIEENLKQMKDETDWRKKASIAAKIISLGLES